MSLLHAPMSLLHACPMTYVMESCWGCSGAGVAGCSRASESMSMQSDQGTFTQEHRRCNTWKGSEEAWGGLGEGAEGVVTGESGMVGEATGGESSSPSRSSRSTSEMPLPGPVVGPALVTACGISTTDASDAAGVRSVFAPCMCGSHCHRVHNPWLPSSAGLLYFVA